MKLRRDRELLLALFVGAWWGARATWKFARWLLAPPITPWSSS